MFNESHIPVAQQMDNMYTYLKEEGIEAQLEINILTDIVESVFPPASSLGNLRERRSTDDDDSHNRKQLLTGAVDEMAAGKGFISEKSIKDAACNAISIFNVCDSTEE